MKNRTLGLLALLSWVIFLFFMLAAPHAHAQIAVDYRVPHCIPWVDNTEWRASSLSMGVTKNGAWAAWYCYNRADPKAVQLVRKVGTPAQLKAYPAYLQAISNAKDTTAALAALQANFAASLPLNDPSLALIVADMDAALAKNAATARLAAP